MSSDWQLEQTGVDRVARRLAICAGSVFELNGLRGKASLIFFAPGPELLLPEHNSGMMSVSCMGLLVVVDRGAQSPHCGSLSTVRPSLSVAIFLGS
jgi:hypothetical protein